MRYYNVKSELNKLKEFTKQEKVSPVAFVEQVTGGYLDNAGVFHKTLSDIPARIFIIDDLPKSTERSVSDEKV